MPHLTRAQKLFTKELVCEGLATREFNERAAKFDPPFQLDARNYDGYKRRLRSVINAKKAEQEANAINTGFASKQRRIEALCVLAKLQYEDLVELGQLWLPDVKSIGFGDNSKIIEFETFNHREVDQFRGTLDDIARENGDRAAKTEFSFGDEKSKQLDEKFIVNLDKIYGPKPDRSKSKTTDKPKP
jgi:hypothetical protein